MKTNKFNSSNLILVVAVIVLLAGVSVGTYYGIKETNEKDYLKNKSSIIIVQRSEKVKASQEFFRCLFRIFFRYFFAFL